MSKPARADKPKAKGKREGALPRHGNRSIVVAVSLLRVIASLGRPATLTEIASAARMSAPRAHRYLLGLANTRLVEHSTISGRYDLGSEIVELGVAALGKVDAVRFASEALTPLAEKTGLAAIITVWGTNGPTVIRCEHAELASAVREYAPRSWRANSRQRIRACRNRKLSTRSWTPCVLKCASTASAVASARKRPLSRYWRRRYLAPTAGWRFPLRWYHRSEASTPATRASRQRR
jgi:hypothetical protein